MRRWQASRFSPRFLLGINLSQGSWSSGPGAFLSLPKYLGFLFAFLLVAAAGVQASDSPDPAYLDELLRQAVELRFSDAGEGHLLLNYRENLWKGFRSEGAGRAFFLGSTGKPDPAAYLEATFGRFI